MLEQFKRDVAAELGGLASGFLIDRDFGGLRILDDGLLPADAASSWPWTPSRRTAGGPVEETGLDAAAVESVRDGVDAVKLLIIWRRDDRRQDRVALAERFIAEARGRGVLSVLEPVVRATPAELDDGSWDAEAAIREAARELSILRPVAVQSAGSPRRRRRRAGAARGEREDGGDITGPWVVLSQGVERDRFASAVEAACREGPAASSPAGRCGATSSGRRTCPRAPREGTPRLERSSRSSTAEARPWSGGMTVRLGLLHTVPALAPDSTACSPRRAPGSTACTSWMPSCSPRRCGPGSAPRCGEAVAAHVRYLVDVGADGVLVTCSSIGEATEAAARDVAVPVVRIDTAMAERAVATCAADRQRPASRCSRRWRRRSDPPGGCWSGSAAWAGQSHRDRAGRAERAREAGDTERHDALIADALRAAAAMRTSIVLAQASMAPAADRAGLTFRCSPRPIWRWMP